MKNLNFRLAAAQNFLCFKDRVEFHFEDYGNIVLIKGENFDAMKNGKPSSNGSGKCFGKGTKILMYDGSIKNVEDIIVGDLVMGDDSTPRKVVSLGRGKEKLYRVIPKKGDSYVVNESHILALKNSDLKYDRYKSHFSRQNGDLFLISVKDYLSQSDSYKNIVKGFRAGVEFKKQDVKIDPYFLGLWLGDGSSHCPVITTMDEPIAYEVRLQAEKRSLKVSEFTKSATNAKIYEMTDGKFNNSLLNDLHHYNLINNKHIPIEYLRNSRDVRLNLLAGIIDADGHNAHGYYEICTKFDNLVDDILYLARSLGFAAYRKKPKIIQGKLYHRISISGNCDEIPLKLDYKKMPSRKINKDCLKIGIEIVEEGVGEYYGFETDGNHLFLLSDFTVVHNSSVAEIISYCLYGKTVKPPKKISKADVLHSWNPTKMEVEVWIDDYRIVRSKKPDKLRVWQDKNHLWDKDSEITLGTMIETQKLIDKIIGLNHEAFCNVVVFDDANTQGFLKCDLPSKRKIIENLLGLECYKDYLENCKNHIKDIKDNIKITVAEYETLKASTSGHAAAVAKIEQQEKDWKENIKNQCDNLMLRIRQKQQKLETFDIDQELAKYQEAQEKMLSLNASIPKMELSREKASAIIKDARDKLDKSREEKNEIELKVQEYKSQLIAAQGKIDEHKELKQSLTKLESNKGDKCPVCHGVIDSKNYESVLTHSTNVIEAQKTIFERVSPLCEDLISELKKKTTSIKALEASIEKAEDIVSACEIKVDNIRKEIALLSKIEKPQLDAEAKVLENEIVSLRKQLEEKNEAIKGDSPYKEILQDALREQEKANDRLEQKKRRVKELENDQPYLDYWKEGFGDKGIRKFVIDRVVPALNARLSYLMQYLMEDQIKITFDNELEETIEQKPSDGNPFVYEILSNGEKQRIDFALSQSLGYIRMLECGACPSILFLDEITKGAIDFNGVQGVYNMILELAKERQVFLTTHDVHLLSLLEGCDQISLKKEGGSTKVV